ncbi:phosphatidate cytidylyltransferase [Solimicrobium silvestre]|uniref:Phosphatidate cytidylyltransferase n=1 Tax=Solimicrobium silvestre TaxID=2099400 RepID=A0A2S9GWS5_9BURK|nr:CDP-archaeol synthase [Solimicrobium silvestre]PRC92151.1 CDP-diglyceride synthetase [Solimicrobium silvestre]
MLKTRILTAAVLLAVLLPVLFFGAPLAINILCALFFCAACWESLRLFGHRLLIPATIVWTGIFIWLAFMGNTAQFFPVWALGIAAWIAKFIPSLKFGLPPQASASNRIFSTLYLISILACFLAILIFQRHSTSYLLSVLVIVWVADIGAYFSGKAFGKRKLAPTISPGKSWEGAIGGWVCVVALGAISTQIPFFSDSFSVTLQHHWGWLGLCLVLSLLTALSVVGDLVESQLKRRAQIKDSSNLLPGHGGVLDRIDALISVLPMAILIEILVEITSKS